MLTGMMTKHYPPEGFNERLRQALFDKGLTVTQVARQTSMSRSQIYGYFYYGNQPNVGAFASLCRILGVSADYLLFGKSDKDEQKQH